MPVSCISWHDALAFAEWLTAREHQHRGMPGVRVYRLPTEAEWEFGCRAGTDRRAFWWGEILDDEHAVHSCGRPECRLGPEAVESTPCAEEGRCNPWGLSDMLGNVWEWCLDTYADEQPHRRVLRGGSWGSRSSAGRMLCGFRGHMPADERGDRNGFRLVYSTRV